MRRCIFAALIVAAATGFGVAAPAGAILVTDPTGDIACLDGNYVITWNFPNELLGDITIDSADLSGAATGPVAFSPTTFSPGQTSTGVTVLPGTTSGDITLTIVFTTNDVDPTATAVVTLEGDCEAPATTTVPTTAVTPTTAAAAAGATASPRFTG